MNRLLIVFPLLGLQWLATSATVTHPLRFSLCEIEYTSEKQLLTINLKFFLTDVNEAIVFDPYSKELAFYQPNESAQANQLSLKYLNQFFFVKVNDNIEFSYRKLICLSDANK